MKATLLQGNAVNLDLFLMSLVEHYAGRLWKLKKFMYGLCDAAKAWYLRVKDELLNFGAKVCSLDSALLTFASNEELQGVVRVYVDDFIRAGNEYLEKNVIKELSDLFLIGGAESEAFKYVGLNLDYKGENARILADQSQDAVVRVRVRRHSNFSESEKR